MPDVLDQAEVDALLAAVEEQGGDFDSGAAPEPFGGAHDEAPAGGQRVSVYDFKRPERVSKDQMRSLRALHEVFARNLSISLSAFLRSIVEVKLISVEQLTYSEFIMSLPSPTCFNKLSMEPLEGSVILEINPSIVFPIMDKLLGGGKTSNIIPPRPLTEIEMRVVNKILDQAITHLENAWVNIKEIDFEIEEQESNPQILQIVAPNEVVVLISFEIQTGEMSGMLNLCIPFLVIEPIMSSYDSHSYFSGFTKKISDPDMMARVQENISDAVLDLRCVIAETSFSIQDFMNLQVGDIVTTRKLAGTDIMLQVGGINKYRCRPGKFRNFKAVQITDTAEPSDHV